MCKQQSRSIYLEHDGKIDRYELVYSRFPESMIKREISWDFVTYLLEHFNGNVHVDTLKKLEEQFAIAVEIACQRENKSRVPNKNRIMPRYMTIIMLYDKANRAIGGGSSVCTAIDIPDRKLGYRLAFERMKTGLHESGYTIIPRVEAEKLLGV